MIDQLVIVLFNNQIKRFRFFQIILGVFQIMVKCNENDRVKEKELLGIKFCQVLILVIVVFKSFILELIIVGRFNFLVYEKVCKMV